MTGFVGASSDAPAPKAATHQVQLLIRPREGVPIPEFYFEPVGLKINPSDTVRFVAATPDHSVTAYHAAQGWTPRVPDGVPQFSSPVLAAGSYWQYTFTKEGVYDIYCGPHQLLGMVLRVVVGSATGPGAGPVAPLSFEETAPPFAPLLTGNLVLSDPALSAENIIAKGRVTWDDIAAQSKLPLIAPVGPPLG